MELSHVAEACLLILGLPLISPTLADPLSTSALPHGLPIRSNIVSQIQLIERCMGGVEEQLDAWDQQQQAVKTPGRGVGVLGRASASRLSATVIYDTINLQVVKV